jgi:hypothetical protein
MGVSGTDTPMQRAIKTENPTTGEDIAKDRPLLTKKVKSGCTRRKLKLVRNPS